MLTWTSSTVLLTLQTVVFIWMSIIGSPRLNKETMDVLWSTYERILFAVHILFLWFVQFGTFGWYSWTVDPEVSTILRTMQYGWIAGLILSNVELMQAFLTHRPSVWVKSYARNIDIMGLFAVHAVFGMILIDDVSATIIPFILVSVYSYGWLRCHRTLVMETQDEIFQNWNLLQKALDQMSRRRLSTDPPPEDPIEMEFFTPGESEEE